MARTPTQRQAAAPPLRSSSPHVAWRRDAARGSLASHSPGEKRRVQIASRPPLQHSASSDQGGLSSLARERLVVRRQSWMAWGNRPHPHSPLFALTYLIRPYSPPPLFALIRPTLIRPYSPLTLIRPYSPSPLFALIRPHPYSPLFTITFIYPYSPSPLFALIHPRPYSPIFVPIPIRPYSPSPLFALTCRCELPAHKLFSACRRSKSVGEAAQVLAVYWSEPARPGLRQAGPESRCPASGRPPSPQPPSTRRPRCRPSAGLGCARGRTWRRRGPARRPKSRHGRQVRARAACLGTGCEDAARRAALLPRAGRHALTAGWASVPSVTAWAAVTSRLSAQHGHVTA